MRPDIDILRSDINILWPDIDILRLDIDILRLDIGILWLDIDILRPDIDILRPDERLARIFSQLNLIVLIIAKSQYFQLILEKKWIAPRKAKFLPNAQTLPHLCKD